MIECKVCETEIPLKPQPYPIFETIDGCMTDIGAVCRKCIRNWLADYIQMVNPFLHLEGKETFKIRREE